VDSAARREEDSSDAFAGPAANDTARDGDVEAEGEGEVVAPVAAGVEAEVEGVKDTDRCLGGGKLSARPAPDSPVHVSRLLPPQTHTHTERDASRRREGEPQAGGEGSTDILVARG
jgi:hypothetical protein